MSYRLACDGGGRVSRGRAGDRPSRHRADRALPAARRGLGVHDPRHRRPADALWRRRRGGDVRAARHRGLVGPHARFLAGARWAAGARRGTERRGASVAVTRYEACRGGAVVQRWTVEGGGHTWPGRPAPRPLRERLSGPPRPNSARPRRSSTSSTRRGGRDDPLPPHRQSRRDRLPDHPHRAAAGDPHGRGLFGCGREGAACARRRTRRCISGRRRRGNAIWSATRSSPRRRRPAPRRSIRATASSPKMPISRRR